ncbi:MAG: oxidoreductase [Anaerolineae bacterium]|nr:oxidoreductase [Gemmatimonadaceae bacterium]
MSGREGKSVLILGATGLVGNECVRQFAHHPAFERVVVLARKPLPPGMSSPKVREHIVEFDGMKDYATLFSTTHVLCALGTTLRSAGSKSRFRDVDYGFVLTAARLGKQQGARHFLLVSSLGADPSSRVFYSRVKGEAEVAVAGLSYRSLTIVRPSLLLGTRREFRLGEALTKPLAFLAPAMYRPVHARDVAAALLHAAVADQPGRRIIESRDIRALARSLPSAESGEKTLLS